MNIALSLQAKGVGGLAARAGTILSRFGATPARMERYLNSYADLAEEFGVHPTLPITACVLARHPRLIRRLTEERNIEFAIHGLVHNDHAALSAGEQRETIARAGAIFQSAGVPYAGFRGPYLRYNQATDEAVRELGLLYHSSQAVAFEVLPRDLENRKATAYHRALQLYGALDAAQVAVRPRNRQGLIDIPVVVPDDEIMVDRLHMDPHAQAAVWLSILDTTHARGDLFTMQLHPERISDSAHALRAVLEAARSHLPGVWIARLDEIASWWVRRGQTALTVDQLEGERCRVRLEGAPEQATLLVRGMPAVDSSPWSGRDRVARTRSFEIRTSVKPVVGVSSRSPQAALDFLAEEGLPAEISDDRARFGAYLDIPAAELDEAGILSEIERAPGPLVRLWRWPEAARSALAVTGDIDSITLQDFGLRLWETRKRAVAASSRRPVTSN